MVVEAITSRVLRHLKGQRIKNENVGHSKLAFQGVCLFDARHHNWSETLTRKQI
jgi:hypothetical protein